MKDRTKYRIHGSMEKIKKNESFRELKHIYYRDPIKIRLQIHSSGVFLSWLNIDEKNITLSINGRSFPFTQMGLTRNDTQLMLRLDGVPSRLGALTASGRIRVGDEWTSFKGIAAYVVRTPDEAAGRPKAYIPTMTINIPDYKLI